MPSPKGCFSTHFSCGHTAGCIKIALGTEVDLSLGDIVLDEDPAPPPLKGHSPQFSANFSCGETARWTKIPLDMEVGFGPGDFVFDEDPAPAEKKGTVPQPPPNFWPMPSVATRLDGSICHLVQKYRPRPRPHCVRRGPNSPRESGTAVPLFPAYDYCGHGRLCQLLHAELLFSFSLTPNFAPFPSEAKPYSNFIRYLIH